MDNVLFLVAISTWFDDGENHILCVCVVCMRIYRLRVHTTHFWFYLFSLSASLSAFASAFASNYNWVLLVFDQHFAWSRIDLWWRLMNMLMPC